jgi:hypothetical protein
LSDEKKQVIALGQMDWTLWSIEEATSPPQNRHPLLESGGHRRSSAGWLGVDAIGKTGPTHEIPFPWNGRAPVRKRRFSAQFDLCQASFGQNVGLSQQP